MNACIANVFVWWAQTVGIHPAAMPDAAAVANALVIVGALWCVAGCRLYRPTFSMVTFVAITAGLTLLLSPVAPRIAVVSCVAVFGVFGAFVALFTKRLAISCLSVLGMMAFAYVVCPLWQAVLVGALVGLAVSLIRPKIAIIVTSALVGSALAADVAPDVAAVLGVELDFADAVGRWGVTGALVALGCLVQWPLARRSPDVALKQKLTLRPNERNRKGRVEPASEVAAAEGVVSVEGGQSAELQDSALSVLAAGAATAVGALGTAALLDSPGQNPARRKHEPPSGQRFRKEIKYRITEVDYLRLRNTLDAYLSYDPHSGPDGYAVRSLYFDSLDDRDLYDKLDGCLEHKKIRLRAYDPAGPFYNLEYKCRWDQDGNKRKLKLNQEQARRLIANDYAVLLEFEPDPLARELYTRMLQGHYSAKVVVEYHRIAWCYPASDIRITWDRGIRASYFPTSFFEESPLFVPIIPPDQGVLEVKYDRFFLSVIKEALCKLDQLPVSNSKYALGRIYL